MKVIYLFLAEIICQPNAFNSSKERAILPRLRSSLSLRLAQITKVKAKLSTPPTFNRNNLTTATVQLLKANNSLMGLNLSSAVCILHHPGKFIILKSWPGRFRAELWRGLNIIFDKIAPFVPPYPFQCGSGAPHLMASKQPNLCIRLLKKPTP